MWLGELITQRGIGNGMSILIFTSIISTLPASTSPSTSRSRRRVFLRSWSSSASSSSSRSSSWSRASGASRFSTRSVSSGEGCTAGTSTYIPLKVNQAGVIPIIFASSVLYIPSLLQNVIQNQGFQNFITTTS